MVTIMNNSLFIKNIKYLVSCDPQDRVLSNINMYIENGIIIDISEKEWTADTVIDGSDMCMYPGLVNTH
ncbi:MAG: 8-oxoguanine deaminase, partial [Mobilitalea sp.]